MFRAASLSNIPQSLPLSSQSLRPSRLAPLTSLRRRVLRRRPRFATPGTPVVARPSFYAVVFATRVSFPGCFRFASSCGGASQGR